MTAARSGDPEAPRDKRAQRRIDLAFNNAFTVVLSNPLLGESNCIARNVSCGGMFVECNDPFPLGSEVKIRFSLPRTWLDETEDGQPARTGPLPVEIVARGEVKNHYFINYADRGLGPRSVAGMGVRFIGFDANGDELLRNGLARFRLH